MRSHPSRIRSLGICCSLMVHLGGFAVLASWRSPDIVAPRLGGQELTIQMQIERLPQWQPETEVLEIPPTVQVPIVIQPKTAQVERRRFQETPSSAVPLEELLRDEAKLLAESQAAAAEQRSPEISEPAPQPIEDRPANPSPRRPSPREMQLPTVAQLPQIAGDEPLQRPRLLNNAPPVYPDRARLQGWQGTVLLKVSIGTDGRVEDVEIVRSSGYDILDGAAVLAVRRWRFEPARRGAQSIATVEYLPVQFELP